MLDERWTLLVVRELLSGSRHFAELRRGLPRMSPTLLSQRLQRLGRAGVIERRENGNRVEYVPTAAGQELLPIVEALGTWGTRWIPELGDEDLDPHLLMWDMHRNIDLDAVPHRRTVAQFTFTDVDPGFGVGVAVETDLRTLTHVWRGDWPWSKALRSGALTVHGTEAMRRQLPHWLELSHFATVPRPARPPP